MTEDRISLQGTDIQESVDFDARREWVQPELVSLGSSDDVYNSPGAPTDGGFAAGSAS